YVGLSINCGSPVAFWLHSRNLSNVKVVLLFLALLATAVGVRADDAIALAVSPRVTLTNEGAHLKVVVEPNDANRQLSWEVDGPTYCRSSTVQLEGSAAPRRCLFFVTRLPAGDFTIRATVRRNNNTESVAFAMISVKAGR